MQLTKKRYAWFIACLLVPSVCVIGTSYYSLHSHTDASMDEMYSLGLKYGTIHSGKTANLVDLINSDTPSVSWQYLVVCTDEDGVTDPQIIKAVQAALGKSATEKNRLLDSFKRGYQQGYHQGIVGERSK